MDAAELVSISLLLLMAILAAGMMSVVFIFVCDIGDWLSNKRNRHGRR